MQWIKVTDTSGKEVLIRVSHIDFVTDNGDSCVVSMNGKTAVYRFLFDDFNALLKEEDDNAN